VQATDKQRYDRECLERPNDIPKPRKVTRRKKPAAKVCDASIPYSARAMRDSKTGPVSES
jgi:hypothetical protein